jgi:hypothetical protein
MSNFTISSSYPVPTVMSRVEFEDIIKNLVPATDLVDTAHMQVSGTSKIALNLSTLKGNGLVVSGTTLQVKPLTSGGLTVASGGVSVNTDATTIELSGGNLRVKASSITSAHIAPDTVVAADIGANAVGFSELNAGTNLEDNGSGAVRVAQTMTGLTSVTSAVFVGALTGNASGTAANVTGTIATTKGGTGLTGVGTAGQILATNSGATGLEWVNNTPNLAALTDTTITSPGSGSILYYDGSWKDSDSIQVDATTGNVGIGGAADSSAALAVTGSFKLGSDTAIPSLVAPAGGLELTSSGIRVQPSGNSSLKVYLCGPQAIDSSSTATIGTTVEHHLSAGDNVTIFQPDKTIASTAYVNGDVTFTTTAAHGFTTGDKINIRGVQATYDVQGNWTVTVLTTTTFSIPTSSSYNVAYDAGGFCRKVDDYIVSSTGLTTTAFQLTGFTAPSSYTGWSWSHKTYTYAEKPGERSTTGTTAISVNDKFPNVADCLTWLGANAAGTITVYFETPIEEWRSSYSGFKLTSAFLHVSFRPGTQATQTTQSRQRKLWTVHQRVADPTSATTQYLFWGYQCDLSVFALKIHVIGCGRRFSTAFLQQGPNKLRIGGLDLVLEGDSSQKITGATNVTTGAGPVLTHTGHGLSTGARVRITGALGMPEINNTATNQRWKIVRVDDDSYTLQTEAGAAWLSTSGTTLTNQPTVKSSKTSYAGAIVQCQQGASLATNSEVTGAPGSTYNTVSNQRIQIDMSDLLTAPYWGVIRLNDNALALIYESSLTSINPDTSLHAGIHFYGGSVNAFATDILMKRLFHMKNFCTVQIFSPITRDIDTDFIAETSSGIVPYTGNGYGSFSVSSTWQHSDDDDSDGEGNVHPTIYLPATTKIGTDPWDEDQHGAAYLLRKANTAYGDGSVIETEEWAQSDHQHTADTNTDSNEGLTGTTSIITSTVLTTNPIV